MSWKILFVSCLILSCKTTMDPSSSKAIIGHDDRIPSQAYSNSVGVLYSDSRPICTAFVTSRNEITTAAHCLSEEDVKYEFRLINSREKISIKSIKILSLNSDVVVLHGDVERGSLATGKFIENKTSTIVSYSIEDSRAVSNTVDKIAGDQVYIYHSLDTVRGSSGSPIIQDGKVVGVHVGTLSAQNINLAVKLDKLDDAKIYLFKDGLELEGWKLPKKIGGSIGKAIGVVTNPIRDNVTAPLANSTDKVFRDIANSVGGLVAPRVANKAKSEGWSKASCRTIGAAAILLPAAAYIAPACAASGVATLGIGVAPCAAAVSGAVVEATCLTLCDSHNLSDC